MVRPDLISDTFGQTHDLCVCMPRTTAAITLALGFMTVVLFMYILFIPLIRGEKPDVCTLRLHASEC